jgi:hypothetical protein
MPPRVRLRKGGGGLGSVEGHVDSHARRRVGTLQHHHRPLPSELGLQFRERQLTDGATLAHLAPFFASRRLEYVEESAIGRSHPNPDVCRCRCDDSHVKNVSWRIKRDDVERGSRTPPCHPESRALPFAGKILRLSGCVCAALDAGLRWSVLFPPPAAAANDEYDEKRQCDSAHLPTVRRTSEKSPVARRGRSVCEAGALAEGRRYSA